MASPLNPPLVDADAPDKPPNRSTDKRREVALSLTETILDRLGATPEQIDRERDRAHRDLFGHESAASAKA